LPVAVRPHVPFLQLATAGGHSRRRVHLAFHGKQSWKTGAGLTVWLTAGLYTHYVPGLALLATANLALLRKRRFRDALGIDALVALAYLPWMGNLAAALGSWGTRTGTYMVTGAVLTEVPVKLAFWGGIVRHG